MEAVRSGLWFEVVFSEKDPIQQHNQTSVVGSAYTIYSNVQNAKHTPPNISDVKEEEETECTVIFGHAVAK